MDQEKTIANTNKNSESGESIDKKYSIFQNLAYCIRATKQGHAVLLVFCMSLILVNCLVPILTTFLPKVVIELIMNGEGMQHLLIVTGIFTLSLAVLERLKKYLEQLVYWNRFMMNTFFLRKVTQKGLTTDYRNQENEHFRTLQNESFASCNGNFSYYNQIYDAMVLFFSSLLGFLTFFGILVTLNPFFLLFLCGTTVIGFLLNRKVTKWLTVNVEEKAGYEQKMQYVLRVANDVQAAKDIRLYNMAAWLQGFYEKNLKNVMKWYRIYTAKVFGVSCVDSVVTFIREGVTYFVLLCMVIDGQISIAEFVLYVNIVAGFSTWLGSILGQLNHLEILNLSVNRFRSYLEYPEEYLREGGKEVPCEPRKMELRNVSFRYEENGKDILKKINLTLEPGEHLAIVGLNGAGKTTLIKLMLGLNDPTSGSVLYDGVDVREYNREKYYQIFGAVFQDHSLMPVSIEEIVAEKDPEEIDEQKVETCLKKAGLWDKMESFADGMKRKYDRSFWEDGINLSGGEIQKLLLARALYGESPVIILDEPTAALDPISESRLYETYNEVMEGKSTVFISHRLSSTRFCTRILLIENGDIIEEGTHEQLLAAKGRYYELFEMQAKYYRDDPDGKEEGDEA